MAISAEIVGSNQPGGDTQPSSIDNFNFSSLREQAMEAFGGNDTPEADTQVSNEPVVQTQEQVNAPQTPEPEPTNVDNASSKQLAALKDDDLVEVTVDGEQVQMPWKDARGGVMRQAKFTKEMTALRRQQEQFQAQQSQIARIQQEHAALRTVLQDKNLLRQVLEKSHPDLLAKQQEVAAQAAQVDPDDIATVGQLQKMQSDYNKLVQTITQQVRTELGAAKQAIAQELEDDAATAKLATDINSTIKTLFDENPFIPEINPDAEQLLRWKVSQLNPTTPEETLEAFKTVVGGWVEKYNAQLEKANKQQVLNKQKLVQTNIQPPGGSAVQQTPVDTKSLVKDGKIDWKAVNAQARATLGIS